MHNSGEYYLKPERSAKLPSWASVPRIAVLMPLYNHSRYIRQSVESVLSQTGVDITIFIIDDGSEEDPLSEIKDLTIDGRIKIRQRANIGLPLTLNELTNWAHSNVDFLTWHSADNFFLNNHTLESLTKYIFANPDISLAYSDVAIVDDKGKGIQNSNYRKADQQHFVDGQVILNLDYNGQSIKCYNDNFINACFLFRNRFSSNSSLYAKATSGFEDFVHWLNLSMYGELSHFKTETPSYAYRLHNDSITASVDSGELRARQSQYFNLFYDLKLLSDNSKLELNLDEVNKETKQVRLLSSSFSANKNQVADQYSKSILSSSSLPLWNKRSLIHKGHRQYCDPGFNAVGLNTLASFTEKNLSYLRSGIKLSSLFVRARRRDLGFFGDEYKQTGRVLIFAPDLQSLKTFPEILGRIVNFVCSNSDLGIVIYASTEGERAVADKIYLESALACNLRIIDMRLEHIDTTISKESLSLLNAIGSVDAVISLLCFCEVSEAIDWDDYSAELALCGAASRVLFAPYFTRDFYGPMPIVYECKNLDEFHFKFSESLPVLKNELIDASNDSVVRFFGQIVAKREYFGILAADFLSGID